MLRHVAGLAEIVDDVAEAAAYYRDVLGMQVEKQDGDDYVMLTVPGVLHFGIWNRAHAAECVYGSRDHVDRVPLGYTLEFEVDDVEAAAEQMSSRGLESAHGPRTEPWGQKVFRMLSPGGAILGFAETPWARRLTQDAATGDSGGGL